MTKGGKPVLPYMDTKPFMRPTVRTQFRGLNNNLSAQDGEIVWMENMSSREYPLLANRKKRALVQTITKSFGLGARDELYWVSGTGFYYNGVLKGTVAGSEKQFAAMGQMILIFPDKKYYDIDADTFGNLALGVSGLTGVQFMNGTYAGVPANANTIYKAGAQWSFSAGDALAISGCTTHPENNKTAIVREVAGDYLRFYEGTFTLDSTIRYTAGEEGLQAGTYHFEEGGQFTLSSDLSEGDTLTWNGTSIDAVIGGVSSTIAVTTGDDGELLVFSDIPTNYTEAGTLSIGREVPDMDYVCVNENRVWGCKGDTIYASALGDPFNFNVFDGLSTDSWQSAVPDEGDFTACVSYGGYPIFFKEFSICKVQGDKPSNFQWTISSRFGVKDGSSHSLAIAGETLFYLSPAGICAYNGGAPSVISDRLGANTKWSYAYGGSDGIRYYASMEDENEDTHINVFDTRYNEWHREDDLIGYYAFCDESLYLLDKDSGYLWRLDGDTDYGTAEGTFPWVVVFADSDNFFETTDTQSQNKKGPLRLLIRAKLANETTVTVNISYDDGTTQTVGTLTGTSSEKKKSYIIPLILRRCDHYQLSLAGAGDAVIYSITMERYSGSQYQASSGVTLPNSGIK